MNYFNQYIKSLFIFACVYMTFPIPALMSQTPSPTEKINKPKSLISVLEKSGVFTVFLSAVRQAGLEDKLGKEGVFTILAPRDSAFAHVESIPREKLFSSKLILKRFVEQHILIGDLSLIDLSSIDSVSTLGGLALPVEHKETIEIGRAKVMRSDIIADNGIIFLLDRAVMVE